MNGPARTWNAVVAGEDTPCWPGTRRHERLKACAAHGRGKVLPPRFLREPRQGQHQLTEHRVPAHGLLEPEHPAVGMDQDIHQIPPSATRDRQRTTPPASRHGGCEVQTQIELSLAGSQMIPSGGFQYLQLGVVMRRPDPPPRPRRALQPQVEFALPSGQPLRPGAWSYHQLSLILPGTGA